MLLVGETRQAITDGLIGRSSTQGQLELDIDRTSIGTQRVIDQDCTRVCPTKRVFFQGA